MYGSTAAALAPACRAPQSHSRSYINVSSYETTWKEIYVCQFELDSAICGINASYFSKLRPRPIANTIKRQLCHLLPTRSAQSPEPILILLMEKNRVEISPFCGTFTMANRSFSITGTVCFFSDSNKKSRLIRRGAGPRRAAPTGRK